MNTTCQKLEEQLTPYLLGDLDPARTEAIREHLKTCAGCRALAEDLKPTLQLLGDALAADSVAMRLAPERKQAIRGVINTRSMTWWRRHARPLAVAAALLITSGVFVGLLLPRHERMKIAQEVQTFEVTIGKQQTLELEPVAKEDDVLELASAKLPKSTAVMDELQVSDVSSFAEARREITESAETEVPLSGPASMADFKETVRGADAVVAGVPAESGPVRQKRVGLAQPEEPGTYRTTASPLPADMNMQSVQQNAAKRAAASFSASRDTDVLNALQRITFPAIQMREAGVVDVVAYLEKTSRELDPLGRGVSIVVEPAPASRLLAGQVAVGGGGRPQSVTLNLRDVTLREALQVTTEALGLRYGVRGDTIVISP